MKKERVILAPIIGIIFKNSSTKLFGLQWQGVPFKDVLGEYWVWFPGWTTLGQCACLYIRVGLVAHHWWVGNQCESQKNNI